MVELYLQQFARQEADLMSPELAVFNTSRLQALWEAIIAVKGDKAPVPFWCVVWPGARALARYILDHKDQFRGRRVLDAACGSGLAGIAAAKCGARVRGIDISPEAIELAKHMSHLNGTDCEWVVGDAFAESSELFDIVLVGDVFYDQALARKATKFMRSVTDQGSVVLASDPGRNYCPREEYRAFGNLKVPVDPDLEGADFKITALLTMNRRTN